MKARTMAVLVTPPVGTPFLYSWALSVFLSPLQHVKQNSSPSVRRALPLKDANLVNWDGGVFLTDFFFQITELTVFEP